MTTESSSSAPPPQNTASMRKAVAKGAVWTLLGFGFTQALRLSSNLLMTRLLAPEHFGLMAIVTVVLIGLAMFSDIGLGPAVIRSPNISKHLFLDTAWTIQIIRGVLLSLVCLLLGFPAAVFYQATDLAYLIPVSGLALLISSFGPMQVHTLAREMNIGKITVIEVAAQGAALLAMLVMAKFNATVWVLVLGSLVAAALRVTAQWITLPGHQHRLALEASYAKELIGFGQWVFISSLLSFAANSAGSLVLGKVAEMELVGLFAIASTLAKVAEQLFDQVSSKVLFPAYSNMFHSIGVEAHRRVEKIRLALVLFFVPPMLMSAMFAKEIFSVMFDERYRDSAWIFQLMVIGYVPAVVTGTVTYLVAVQGARLGALVAGIRLAAYIAAITVGYIVNGAHGAIVGICLLPVIMYTVDLYLQRKNGLISLKLEMLVWVPTAGVVCWIYV